MGVLNIKVFWKMAFDSEPKWLECQIFCLGSKGGVNLAKSGFFGSGDWKKIENESKSKKTFSH